jgi:purine-binding chemotaxis protein CheW
MTHRQERASRREAPPETGDVEAVESNGMSVDAATSDTRQFVTFIVGEQVFAVDMAPVQEIIRVPDVVHVPLAPSTLDGLANLRGRVLPIFSLQRIFGLAERAHDDATRALVIDLGQPLGFVVDRVVSVIGVESSRIEGTTALAGTVDTDLLSGIIKDVDGHAMIMVLDFARLIAREFSDMTVTAARTVGSRAFADDVDDEEDTTSSNALHLVSFDVAGQEYAIAIEDVQEIVQLPEQIVQVPHSAPHALGVMMLRNRLLPLASLRRLFALSAQEANERSRIVVVSLDGHHVGIVTDSVNEVLRVSKTDVDPMPPLLARDADLADISQICRIDGGKRLVSVVSAHNLFRHSAIKDALTAVDGAREPSGSDARRDAESDDDEQMVVFRLGKEEFGVPIGNVQEIVRVPDTLTQVPKAPSFVEGVINLRGAVLPVIDLRRRLGLVAIERSDRQRVMVFVIDDLRTGYIVDSVAEVRKIRMVDIEPAPRMSSDQEHLLSRVANLGAQQRMVQLIAPQYLIESRELAALTTMAA